MRAGTTCLQYSLLWTGVNTVVRVWDDACRNNLLAIQFTGVNKVVRVWDGACRNNLLAIQFTVDWRKHDSRPWVSLEGEAFEVI